MDHVADEMTLGVVRGSNNRRALLRIMDSFPTAPVASLALSVGIVDQSATFRWLMCYRGKISMPEIRCFVVLGTKRKPVESISIPRELPLHKLIA